MRRGTVVDTDGHRIAYSDEGIGHPVLLLHALGRSAADWHPVTADLARSFRCIAIDLPGHGDSARFETYSFDRLVQATETVVDALGIEEFALVAHSMGATVAWLLAPDLGSRLTALVVEDTPAPTDRHEYPEVPATPPEHVDYDWEVRRQIFRELDDPDPEWRRRVPSIHAPVLLVAGAEDDTEMRETCALLDRADIVTVPVGHWIHQDAPTEFTVATRSFLERHTP